MSNLGLSLLREDDAFEEICKVSSLEESFCINFMELLRFYFFKCYESKWYFYGESSHAACIKLYLKQCLSEVQTIFLYYV